MLCAAFLVGQTYHSGKISSNEAWFSSDNPHIIDGNLTISDGVTLLVQAGCEVKFQGNRRLLVNGILSANGTSANPIVFTSNQAVPAKGDWRFIYFDGADNGSILNYCVISYGGSSSGMVRVKNSTDNVIITNCNLSNSGGYGIILNNNAANPLIMDCTIEDCSNYPIYTRADRVKDITGTMMFANNTPNAIYVRQMNVTTGIWLNHGVPYIIGGNFRILDLETLTLEAGNELKFNGTNTITVLGALIANGTSTSPILFTSNQAVPDKGDWNRIYFNNAESSSLINCEFEYAGSGSSTLDIRNSGTNVTISNCSIDNSGGYGVYNRNGSLTSISDVSVQNCDNYPIYALANGVKNITGTMTFSGNTPEAIFVKNGSILTGAWLNHGIPYVLGGGNFTVPDLETLTISPGVTLKIDGNRNFSVLGSLVADGDAANHITFTSNEAVPSPGDWRRIYFNAADAGSILDYCDVYYSGSTNANLDIRNSGSNIAISNSRIEFSNGYGVYIRNNSSPSFINCEIVNNDGIGVYINGASAPTFGMDETEWNDIYGNGTYELRNGSLDIDAKYVYWGTTSCGSISDLIYDDEDQANLGIVDYMPWLDAGHGSPSLATTWTGATNTSWHENSNWDNNAPCWPVDATIPEAPSNQPMVFADEACNDLTLEAGSRLTVSDGNTLSVNGDFLMEADANGFASLVENSGIDISGTSSVEYYLPESRWHHLSSPMTGQTANVFWDIYLYSHDEAINSFTNVSDENTPLNIGEGFQAWASPALTGTTTVTYSGGDLNSGLYTLPVTNTGSGFNFVGNPYPSAVDWDNLSWIKTYIDGTIYVYDGDLGQYLSWNGSVGDLTGGIIPAMQGFFVTANGPTPSLAVSNGARSHGVDPYKESVSDLIELSVVGNGFSDNSFINFNEEATIGFDGDFDGYKLFGDEEAPQLYSMANEKALKINVMPEINDGLIVPLGLQVGIENEYTIVANTMGSFTKEVSIYLEDLKEKAMIDLSLQPDYTFIASPEDEAARFLLHFGTAGIDENATIEMDHNFTIYSFENSVYVKNNAETLSKGEIFVFNIMGQEVYHTDLHNLKLNRIDLFQETGYYIIKVVSQTGVYSEKVFIR